MKSKRLILILLFLVIALASLLRLVALDKYPAGFNADEAAIGYNAYSIIQTDKDEYGEILPTAFKSFGDYKPGLYFYMVVPFVSFLGLNEWAVRMPSALLGIGTVILIYFLGKEIFKSSWIGLIASFLLAVSPWHIHFSRGGWETNAATFFITLGIFLIIKGLERQRFIFASMLSFLASMYTYQSPRLIVPILLLVIFFFYKQKIITLVSSGKKKIQVTGLFLIILTLLSLPLLNQFISGAGGARFTGLSFLSDPGPISRVDELRGEHSNSTSLEAKLLHNKLTAYGTTFLGHYLDHFDPQFLFINGDPLTRNKVPETGQFYLVEVIFLITGLIFLLKFRFEYTPLLIAWVLIAPLASSMTYQTPHALRALNMVIPVTLIMSYGLWKIVTMIKNRLRFIYILIVLILCFEIFHYLESYYIHAPKRYPLAFEYGFSEMVSKMERYEPLYNKVVITDRYDQPYILILFYKQYNPKKYQPQANLSPRDKFNFGTVRSFDKYEFRPISPEELNMNKGTLFIGTAQEIPKDANILDMVRFPNGDIAFIIAEGK